jgi:ferredoxin-thioredoxin reductase catalytic subunit
MFSEEDKKRGLYLKYIIEKADGSPVAPEADYFVLRLDNDKAARAAAANYAALIAKDAPELSKDLIERVTKYIKVRLNPDKEKIAELREALKQTGGQCPCVPKYAWDEDTKCPCKVFRETKDCHCQLYVREE